MRGVTAITDFVAPSTQEAMSQTIKELGVLSLSDDAHEVFVQALLNPPPPNKALRAAADRYAIMWRSD